MAERLIPGGPYVNETGTFQRLLPGYGFINETASGATESTGSSAGVATVTGIAQALVMSVGSSAGTSTVLGESDTGGGSVGASAGSSTVTGVSGSTAISVGNSDGAATVLGVSAWYAVSVGSSSGVATVTGIAEVGLTDSEKIDLILDILQNKQTLSPTTGIYTLYADDGTTVLYTAQGYEDVAGTITYRGGALQRLDRMQ